MLNYKDISIQSQYFVFFKDSQVPDSDRKVYFRKKISSKFAPCFEIRETVVSHTHLMVVMKTASVSYLKFEILLTAQVAKRKNEVVFQMNYHTVGKTSDAIWTKPIVIFYDALLWSIFYDSSYFKPKRHSVVKYNSEIGFWTLLPRSRVLSIAINLL